jgi:phosphoribosylamine-glycine ligase
MEYNVRFGVPNARCVLRLMSDLVPALLASRDGVLNRSTCAGFRKPRSPW